MSIPVAAEAVRAVSSIPADTGLGPCVPSKIGAKQPRLADLDAVPAPPWRELRARAIEPNAYYDPLWAVPLSQHASGYRGALALLAWNDDRMIGLMPVRWSRRVLSIPGPLLVGWNAIAALSIPTLDREQAQTAAAGLIQAARSAGAHALLLPGFAIQGPAFAALKLALAKQGLSAEILRSYRRAALDATGNADTTLRDALGAKKLKELRRQRHRLEDLGALAFSVATTPDEVAAALEDFLALEASGWKGTRGTALVQDAGDTAFIREAAVALAARRNLEIVSLTRNGTALASGLILRDGAAAYFFKIAMDEREARYSPGVQLALDLTRHLCADPYIEFADSSTDIAHSMIEHLWRERIEIADVFIALKPGDPVAVGLRLLVQARYRALDLARTVRRLVRK
jgi:CelD/BcsL family acetyltransferase involved in cellulose biosynthesis